jgi:SNF2 family DNA or RNA helicase
MSLPFYYLYLKEQFNEKSWTRGYNYISRVRNWTFSSQNKTVLAVTKGSSCDYNQKVQQTDKDVYDATCNCPYDYGKYCKHISAVLRVLVAQNFDFQSDKDISWNNALLEAKEVIAKTKQAKSNRVIDVETVKSKSPDNLEKVKNKEKTDLEKKERQINLEREKYINKLKDVPTKRTEVKVWFPDPNQTKYYLIYNIDLDDHTYSHANNSHYTNTLPLKIYKTQSKGKNKSQLSVNHTFNRYTNSNTDIDYVTDDEMEFIYENLLYRSYYGYDDNLSADQILSLCNTLSSSNKVYLNGKLFTSPIKKAHLTFSFHKQNKHKQEDVQSYKMQIQLDIINETSIIIEPVQDSIILVGSKRCKLLIYNRTQVYILNNEEKIEDLHDLISGQVFHFNKQEVQALSKLTQENDANNLIILPQEVKIPIIQADIPVPQLWLSENNRSLEGQISFVYKELPDKKIFLDSLEKKFLISNQDLESNTEYYLHRNIDNEEQIINTFTKQLIDNQIPFNRSKGLVSVDGENAINFILNIIPTLNQTSNGQEWLIYGQNNLKIHKYIKPTININLTSGIDWLDLSGEIEFDDTKLNLSQIAKLVRKKQRFIQLGDKTGVLPKDWLEKHKELFELADGDDNNNLRISKWHLDLLSEFNSTINKKDNQRQSWQNTINKCLNWKEISKLDTPEVQATLRPYQQYGYEWLNFLYNNKLGGILADDMGLGKTLQTIAFLQGLYLGQGHKPNLKPTLLILPTSLLINWQMELKRFAPSLKFTLLYGNNRDKNIIKNIQILKDCDELNTHIFITTYGTLLKDIQELKKCVFECVILDESQQIKNAQSLTFKAVKLLQSHFRLSLSGTPVENSLLDLWSQFSFLNPGQLGSFTYFKENFVTTLNKKEVETKLQLLTYPFILRRLKQNVAKELGDKIENIIYVQMEDRQKLFYDQIRVFYKKAVTEEVDTNQPNAKLKVLEGLTKLRQICSHPNLLNQQETLSSSKLDLMLDKLDEVIGEKHKVLIFSQFTSMLAIMKEQLDKKNIKYCYLDGKTTKRQEQVDLFQNDSSIPVFLISLKAGGVGLNLTAADYVFIFDPWWNPAAENQAIDRTHRIGQEKNVFVYRFVVKDSIEEKILQLQASKQELVKNIITADESFIKKLDKKALQSLFS